MRRRAFLQGSAALSLPHLSPVFAQTGKVARVGVLSSQSAAAYARRVAALKAGLADLGYVEGRNLRIEYRWAEGKLDRLGAMSAELLEWKPDVIVTHGTPGTLALKKATSTVPIVAATLGDAVGVGVVPSLAQPGGNITGSTIMQAEMYVKRLEVLKDAVPGLANVALLFNPDNPASQTAAEGIGGPAKALNITVSLLQARNVAELDAALAGIAKRRIDALMMAEDATFIANDRKIAEALANARVPSIGYSGYARVGGLFGYGVNTDALWRRAAYFVDRILKGARPRDLPVERAATFELTINMATASALGLKLPTALLLRADMVIQ